MTTTLPDKTFTTYNEWIQYIHFEHWRMKYGQQVKNTIYTSIEKLKE